MFTGLRYMESQFSLWQCLSFSVTLYRFFLEVLIKVAIVLEYMPVLWLTGDERGPYRNGDGRMSPIRQHHSFSFPSIAANVKSARLVSPSWLAPYLSTLALSCAIRLPAPVSQAVTTSSFASLASPLSLSALCTKLCL
ncbi:hypothetical protein K1719_021225 [Acacia pycnantha]|nr:hypothetical protein K1719_021225 [Acacia pycnantha]